MSYQDAIETLNILRSNTPSLASRIAAGFTTKIAIAEVSELVTRAGFTPNDLNALNVIHIAGTKGKGSTSAFTDSILRHARPGIKVGLFTSPHLVTVREQIRINSHPLSEEEFAKYFFQLWKKLQDNPPTTSDAPAVLSRARYLTLLAFHVFKDLQVDATILEVGIGGGGDSTNVVPKPVVTGITALGMDHVTVLGGTIEAIAGKKAGIYKKDVPALSIEQHYPSTNLEAILEEAAMNVKASEFRVAKVCSALKAIKLGLAGRHQLVNASLAVELARTFLTKCDGSFYPEPLPQDFIAGLENVKWPGRCQTVLDTNYPSTTWYLDCAHTEESLKCCIEWFASPGVGISDQHTVGTHLSLRVLIFSCTPNRPRPGDVFLKSMLNKLEARLSVVGSSEEAGRFFDQVIFCSNVTYTTHLTSIAPATADPNSPDRLKQAWSNMAKEFPVDAIHSLPSIDHAIRKVREYSQAAASPVQVLVTGSLYLVGGVIEVTGLSSIALGDL